MWNNAVKKAIQKPWGKTLNVKDIIQIKLQIVLLINSKYC